MMNKKKMFIVSLLVMTVAGLTFFVAGPSFAYTDDIISLWALEEDVPPYLDSIGANDGLGGVGGPPYPPSKDAGQVGFSQVFNGLAPDLIDVNAPIGFDWLNGDSFSIEFWMNSDVNVNPAAAMVVVGRDDVMSWWVGASQTNGRAAFYLRDSDGNEPYLAAPFDSEVGDIAGAAKITDGNWHYVVAVRDGVNGLNLIYVDGVLQESRAVAYTGDFDSAAAEVTIGYYDVGGMFYFTGRIDELAIYGRALPQGEIDDHFAAGTAGLSVTTVGPDPGPPVVVPPPAGGGGGGGGGCFINSLF